ncbi:MAG: 3-oxoacyl-[acyl-carrier protein] reductase, partial [uncultured Phycisphaerae bacterium]
ELERECKSAAAPARGRRVGQLDVPGARRRRGLRRGDRRGALEPAVRLPRQGRADHRRLARAGTGAGPRVRRRRRRARRHLRARRRGPARRRRRPRRPRRARGRRGAVRRDRPAAGQPHGGRGRQPPRRHRRAGQQRRDDHGRPVRAHDARRLRGGDAHPLLRPALRHDRGPAPPASPRRGADREHLLDRRQGRRPAPAAVFREQVRPHRLVRGAPGRAPEGQHLRHDGLPRPDAHGQPAQRVLQGPAPPGVRVVPRQRRAAADRDARAPGGAAGRQRLPLRPGRGDPVGAGEAGRQAVRRLPQPRRPGRGHGERVRAARARRHRGRESPRQTERVGRHPLVGHWPEPASRRGEQPGEAGRGRRPDRHRSPRGWHV